MINKSSSEIKLPNTNEQIDINRTIASKGGSSLLSPTNKAVARRFSNTSTRDSVEINS